MPKTPIGDSEFVVIWQRSRTLDDVVRLAGYTSKKAKSVVGQRAKRLRQRGVDLKTFNRALDDIEKLKWLAARAVVDTLGDDEHEDA